MNLVGNAVKFTRAGEVTVRADRGRDAQGEALLVVEVEDTGPGIEPEMVGELFKPFSQARAGLAAHGGTGLGLAISRDYARLMGGDITVTSRPGHGVRLPARRPARGGARDRSPAPAPSGRIVRIGDAQGALRILIIDDDADSRDWLRLLLLDVGYEVVEAGDGIAGLALVASWRPHVVLTDVEMPGMDGAQVIEAILAMPPGERPVVVAVTASAFDDQKASILATGAAAVLHKPCREGPLLEELGRRLGVTYLRAPVAEAEAEVLPPPAGPLPADLATALRSAAATADYDRLTELVAAIPADHAAAARALSAMVERFAYDEIEARLRD